MDILTSKAQLEYPLYACDFDAQDAGRLLVGGGGGSSRTGVGNSITLLDSSSASDSSLAAVAEIELSKDEDNVTSLAVGPRCGQTTVAFAGVNSSPADQKQGRNEHFRVFGVDASVPATAAEDPGPQQITELARASFFAAPPAEFANLSDDTYQRLIRVSAPFPDGHGSTLPQLGACATGLARTGTSQIVLFDVAPAASTASALPRVRSRIEQLSKEATDLDVIQTDSDRYQLAFCNDHELFLYDVAANGGSETPVLVYTIPLDVANGATERPVFRSIRYVTPHFVLVALNMPRRMGVRLMGLRLPSSLPASDGSGKTETKTKTKTKPQNTARTTTVHISVPRSVLTQATALAVRGLTQPAAPDARLGDAQFVVAVAGAPDNTIALYTLEHQVVGSVAALVKLYPFRTLRQVHELQMTSIALSPFVPPVLPVPPSAAATPYIRLASVSVMNTVVVHHIPLRRLPGTAVASSAAAAAAAETDGPRPRYVVALKSQGPSGVSLYVFVIVMMVLIAAVSQGLLEIRGATSSVLGARRLAPTSWLLPEMMADGSRASAVGGGGRSPVIDNDGISIAALLRGDGGHDGSVAPPVLFLRGEDADHTIEAVAHNEAEHGPAVAWDGLAPAQQTAWRQRLQDAGHWGEDMGETIFRGVLFSEIAGIVGEMVR